MEPTYRIAQRLHERRAAVGLKTYGRHLDANSQGCMLVHALEESADKTNYLIAEVQRRKRVLEMLIPLADWLTHNDPIAAAVDLLGGRAALAQYDEILGGGTVAENATVDVRDDAMREADKTLAKVISHLGGKEFVSFHESHLMTLAHEAREHIRAAAELIRASGWRPMNTAPRDGRDVPVLVKLGGKVEWRQLFASSGGEYWVNHGGGHLYRESECIAWFELPEPPAREVPNERG